MEIVGREPAEKITLEAVGRTESNLEQDGHLRVQGIGMEALIPLRAILARPALVYDEFVI
jgi:hypothetical protein